MNVKVRYLGGKKFELTARNHSVISDQPSENDGTDSAMTPPELFLSSLGSCAAYYAEEYLRARGLPNEELEVLVSGTIGDRPARIVSLELEVVAPGLNHRHRDGVLRAVNACLLTNTLIVPPHIETTIRSSSPAFADESHLAIANH